MFRILDTKVIFRSHELSPPLIIGKGEISTITEATCQVTITNGSAIAQGYGTVLLSHVWCWPDTAPGDKDTLLREATSTIARAVVEFGTDNTVLGHGFDVITLADQLLIHVPPLARRVCSSPLDNAIHDAAGYLSNQPSFELFSSHGPSPFDPYFPGFGSAGAIESMLRAPVANIEAQMVVGLRTSHTDVFDYCRKFGIRRLKVKIGSGDVQTDVGQVIEVGRAMPQDGRLPDITVDANGCYPTPESLEQFLTLLREQSPEIAVCLSAIEQPSISPLVEDRRRWSAITADMPILSDESFTNLDDLKHANACGWNGLAVKSCRGQTLALLGAAWGHARGWTNTVMDLTSPNIAAIHTVLLASRISGVSTAEVNTVQFLKSGYADLPESMTDAIVPHIGQLSVPNVTSGLVPLAYRPVLNELFEGA